MTPAQTALQRRYLQLAQKATDRLLSERDDVLAVYVYGSVGRGEPTPLSDLDLHVVLDQTSHPEHDHDDFQLDGTRVEYAYHGRSWYGDALAAWEPTPENVEKTARNEGLWELSSIVILHDPLGIVPPARTHAGRMTRHPDVIQARAQRSLGRADAAIRDARDALDRGDAIRAYGRLFLLSGGGGNSGTVSLLANAVIQLGNLPLTTRRHFHRLRQACEALGRSEWYEPFRDLIGVRREPLEAERALATMRELYAVVGDVFERRAEPNDSETQALRETLFNPSFHERAEAYFNDLREHASVEAAIAAVVGFSPRFLTMESGTPHAWVLRATEREREDLLRATAQVARVDEPLADCLRERLDRADLLRERIVASLSRVMNRFPSGRREYTRCIG